MAEGGGRSDSGPGADDENRLGIGMCEQWKMRDQLLGAHVPRGGSGNPTVDSQRSVDSTISLFDRDNADVVFRLEKNIPVAYEGLADRVERRLLVSRHSVDLVSKKLKLGDTFLLCSDGLSNLVDIQEMEKELRERETVLAAKTMVDLANKRGGDDNITLILVEVVEA